MTEMIVNGNLLGATKSEETDSGTTTVEISVLDAFDDKLMISQLVCEPAPELEKLDTLETVQTVEEPQAVSPPADQPTTAPTVQVAGSAHPPEPRLILQQPPELLKPEWTVGAQCQAVWSEDGKVYAATILSVDGERCRVRFDGYGNEEDMDLSSLKQLHVQSKSTQEWKAGSRCRATYSGDGLIYSAVVLWVRGQRCRVRYDNYNNEEELDLSDLLSPDELNGPPRSGRGATWRPMFGTGARRRREASDSGDKREPERGERGEMDRGEMDRGEMDRGEMDRGERDRGARGRDRIWKDPLHNTWQPKDRPRSQSREEVDEKKPAEQPAYPVFSLFPPFAPPPPPPPPHCLGEGPAFVAPPPPFVAPPPPFWTFGGKNSGAGLDPTSHMLMLWYMCGFHTGSYLAQQQHKSSSSD